MGSIAASRGDGDTRSAAAVLGVAVLHIPLTQEEQDTVRRLPLFNGLPNDLFRQLIETSAVKMAEKGQTLFHIGDPADCFYVVLAGWVKVSRVTADGEEAVLGVFTGGESFAEAAMLMGGKFPAGAEVVEDARLVRFDSELLNQMIRSVPDAAMAMLSSMSRHLHLLVHEIEQLKTRTATERLIDFLLRMSRVRHGPATVSLPYDKALIAQRLAIKPESLSRVFSNLRRIGVRSERRSVQIADVARLAAYRNRALPRGAKAGD